MMNDPAPTESNQEQTVAIMQNSIDSLQQDNEELRKQIQLSKSNEPEKLKQKTKEINNLRSINLSLSDTVN